MSKLQTDPKLLYFDALTRAKAERYYTEGRVQSARELGPTQITGRVIGSSGDLYKTNIFFAPDRSRVVTAICNCPVTTGCKHAAALLMHFLENEVKENRPRKVISARQPTFTPVPADVERTLSRLSQNLSPRAHNQKYDRFIYVFPPPYTTNPAVSAGLAKLKRDGQYGSPRLYPLVEAMNRFGVKGELQPEDEQIAQLWEVITAAYMYGIGSLPDKQAMNMVIQRILETGRAYLLDKDGPLLHLGTPLPIQFKWLESAPNRFNLALNAIDGDKSHPCFGWSFPWYVNADTGAMGPAETDLSPQALQTILQLRTLTGGEAKSLPPLLAKLGLHELIPTPPGATPIRVETLPVVPELSVEYDSADDDNPFSKKRKLKPRLHVSIPQGHHAKVSIDPDGTVVRTEHSKLASSEILEQLKDLGFSDSESEFSGIDDGGGSDFWEMEAPPKSWQELSIKIPALHEAGWNTKELENELQLREVDEEAISGGIAYGGSDWWFDLEIEIEVDGKKYSLLPVLAAAIRDLPPADTISDALDRLEINDRFVAFADDGTLLSLPFQRVKAMLLTLHELLLGSSKEKVEVSSLIGAEILALADARWKGLERLRALVERLRRLTEIKPAKAPNSLRAELRPYQSEGLAWLNFLAEERFGGILADDMGLGKTIQVLAHVCAQKEADAMRAPFLVVCPTSVLPNWLKEAKRFAPDLHVVAYHGSERHQSLQYFTDADIILTSYPIVTRDAAALSKQAFHGIALDESQAIKNDSSQISQAVRKLKAHYRFCMSGTPIENHLGELWSAFHFLMPGLLADKKTFTSNIRTPIEKHGRIDIRDSLANRIKPFVLRRTKEQVAQELPDKITIVQPIELTKQQSDLYETIRLGVSEMVKTQIAEKGFNKSQILFLKALLRLRQVCCDPRLIKQAETLVPTKKKKSKNAVEPVQERILSSKLSYLIETLEQLCAEGRKTLVFSQFTSMLDLIEIELKERNLEFVRISGDTQDRIKPVDQFQNGTVPIFLISLKAGGTGLNLTAADTVIHYDPWWNPAVEDQATDRAHRIGQTKKVMVYKLITQGTIEQRMVELQERKRKLAGAIYDADGARSSLAFTEDDLHALLQPLDA